MSDSELIYLDHNATTPLADEVIAAMTRSQRDHWGNPSSANAPGRAASEAVAAARRQVAHLLGCDAGEIVFTSGGTESDNLALMGAARARRRAAGQNEVVISAVEHPAMEEACSQLETEGFVIRRVGVGGDGRVEAAAFTDTLGEATAVASLMLANNETGALQPVAAVAAATRRRRIPFHTDAAQAVGKMPVDVGALQVDLLTVAGHKLYGPRGVGALYVRPGTPLEPVLRGAAQEGGLRPGTENTPAIVGLGAACDLATAEMEQRVAHCRALTGRLLEALSRHLGQVQVNGPADATLRLPNTLNVSLPGTPSHLLLPRLQGVAAAAGAACHSGTPEPSQTLLAMGLDPDRAGRALRLSVGRRNTETEMDIAAVRLAAAARSL